MGGLDRYSKTIHFSGKFFKQKMFLGHTTSIERIIIFSKFENFYKFFFGRRIQSASPRIGLLLENYSFFRKIFQTKNVFLVDGSSPPVRGLDRYSKTIHFSGKFFKQKMFFRAYYVYRANNIFSKFENFYKFFFWSTDPVRGL